MKRRIRIGKSHIAAAVMLAAGLVMLLSGLRNAALLSECAAPEGLSLSSLRAGRYVHGRVSGVVSAEGRGGPASGHWYPVTIADALTGTEYYVIPIGAGEYITLIVPGAYRDSLVLYDSPPPGNAYLAFEGKVVRGLRYGLNYEGLKAALGVETDGEVRELVSPEYAIELISFSAEKRPIWVGAGTLFFGLLILCCSRKPVFVKTRAGQ